MSFARLNKFRRSLAVRLTFWYAGMFTALAAVAFTLFYLLIQAVVQERIDRELVRRLGQVTDIYTVRGIEGSMDMAGEEAKTAGESQVFYRFLAPGGEIFTSSSMSYWRDITVDSSAIRELLEGQRQIRRTAPVPGRFHRVRVIYDFIGPGVILQLGQSMETYDRLFQVFRRIFVGTMAGLVLASGLIGWFLARRALHGVTEVTRTARKIAGGALDQRVPEKSGGDEVDQLAATFNTMLDRIQDLVEGIREMSDNIAHDLRSPVTRIRGLAEVTLTTQPTEADYEAMAASAIEECDRLLDMINTMLVISRTEAGVGTLDMTDLDLAEVARDACGLLAPVAEDKEVTLAVHTDGAYPCRGDVRMIQRMVANLLDNAIEYTPAGGQVTVTVDTTPDGDARRLTVEDTGIGIDSDDLPMVFNRFFRGDESRSLGGAGLGLSFSRVVAEAHGGTITAASEPGKGSTFTVTIPVNTELRIGELRDSGI